MMVEKNIDNFNSKLSIYDDPEKRQWVSINYLINRFHLSRMTIASKISDLDRISIKTATVINLPLYPYSESVQILEYYTNLPRISKRSDKFRDQQNQEWVSLKYAASRGVSRELVVDKVSWFESRGVTGKVSRAYSKREIDRMAEENRLVQRAPEGWTSKLSVGRELNLAKAILYKLANLYKQSHPEWFGVYRGARGIKFEHCHPDFTKALKDNHPELFEAPKTGWTTLSKLAKECNISNDAVKLVVDKYKITNPEWFRRFKVDKLRVFEHVSPEIVTLIKVLSCNKVPEGWITSAAYCLKSGKNHEYLSRVVSQYRDSNPDWFKTFVHRGTSTAEHLSPELVKKLDEYFSSIKPPEVGWVGFTSFCLKYKFDHKLLRVIVEPIRKSNPEWFRLCLNDRKFPKEYLSPDLIKYILDLKNSKVPSSERSNDYLKGLVGV